MTVIVDLALALVCFTANPAVGQECHNVLIGNDTPTGEFKLVRRKVKDPLYGGDVLKFREDPKIIYSIHRVWLGNPAEKRLDRIKSTNVKYRMITKGCVNVEPEVFQKLVDCCSNSKLIIR